MSFYDGLRNERCDMEKSNVRTARFESVRATSLDREISPAAEMQCYIALNLCTPEQRLMREPAQTTSLCACICKRCHKASHAPAFIRLINYAIALRWSLLMGIGMHFSLCVTMIQGFECLNMDILSWAGDAYKRWLIELSRK